MAFADFLDLRTAVIEFVGNVDIAEIMPRLVKLAEVEFNRRLRLKDQITSTPLTVANGVGSLPSDFQEAIGLFDGSGTEMNGLPSSAYHRLYRKQGFFTVEGSQILAQDQDYTLRYFQGIPTITGSMTGTNWLLNKHPNLYLYAIAYEAGRNLNNAEIATTAAAFREEEFAKAKAQDASERFSRARVRVGGVTP